MPTESPVGFPTEFVEPEISANEFKRNGAGLRHHERAIAHMHLAGMTKPAIARYTNLIEEQVTNILDRPRVAQYVMQMTAGIIEDLRPIAERVNQAIERDSERAAQVVREIMEQMHAREEIRAQAIALSSAQDILDRAGHKPKQRVETQNLNAYAISEATLDKMAQVLRELPAARANAREVIE